MRIAQRGYTLIEILIVLFIISIVTSVALLSIHHSEKKQAENFANELAQSVSFAEQQAMLQPNVLGLTIDRDTYHFSSLQNADGKKASWQRVTDQVLAQRPIPDGLEVKVEISGANASDDQSSNPQIILSTNGDVTPFTIYVGQKGKKPLYAVTADAGGNVLSRELS